MKIETKKFMKDHVRMRQITKIISSQDGKSVNIFGYTHKNGFVMKQGEIITEHEFQQKLRVVREAEKEIFGEWKEEKETFII